MDLSGPVSELIINLTNRLHAQSETARLDAQLLTAHAAGQTRSWILTHPEARLTPAQSDLLAQALAEIERGKPLPYILGEWEFYGLRFAIQPCVLIPRPETELLVENASAWCHKRLRQSTASIRAVDVGTGSGCIAISLAVHAPQAHWIASDLSREALQVARQNVIAHRVQDRITLLQADLLAPFGEASFDLVCANPPYIPSATLRSLAVYGREPALALDGGPDGLALIRELLAQARTRLAPGGLLLAEIEASQGASVLQIASACFANAHIHLRQDYAGHDRLLEITLP